MSDRGDVIQGDEQCRDGHYRAKQDLRAKTMARSRDGTVPERLDFDTSAEPNGFGQAYGQGCV
jgi:hypothetical protein